MKRRENCSEYGNELLVWKRLGRIMFIPLGREEESGDRKIFAIVETPGDTGLTPLGETHTLNRRRDDLPSVFFFVVVVFFFNNSLYENENILLLKQSKLESDVLSIVCEVCSWGDYILCRCMCVPSFIKSALRVPGEVLDTFQAFKSATITYWFITYFCLFTWLHSY